MPMKVSIPVRISVFSSKWLRFGPSHGDRAPVICGFAALVPKPLAIPFLFHMWLAYCLLYN